MYPHYFLLSVTELPKYSAVIEMARDRFKLRFENVLQEFLLMMKKLQSKLEAHVNAKVSDISKIPEIPNCKDSKKLADGNIVAEGRDVTT